MAEVTLRQPLLIALMLENVAVGWCLAQGEKGWGNLLQFASKEENMVVNDDLDKRHNGEQHSFAGLSW